MITNQPVLSNLQKELLKLYANGISDEQLIEIKWMLVQYFADKAKSCIGFCFGGIEVINNNRIILFV